MDIALAPAGAKGAAAPRTFARLDSVDLVRGLIMVVMVVDHARDMLGSSHFPPEDLARTTPALFFTRWITHFCAPGFVLLAGTGAFLSRKRRPELARLLLSRGLWLVLVELTLVRTAWLFNLTQFFFPLQVIWAIGWSMVALAALVWLPLPAVGAFGVAMIAAHNLFDGVRAGPLLRSGALSGSGRDWVVSLLHQQNIPVIYPLVPWIGVMALGYALGPLFLLEPARRRRFLLFAGGAACAAFVVLRALNGYGDPSHWQAGHSSVFTLLSFLNTTKYPPSLAYLLMTLGPLLLVLAAAERLRAPALLVFGRVPFFFYVLHLYLIHLLAVALGVAQGFGAAPLMTVWSFFPKAYGVGLGGVYLAWALVVLALHPACRWFAGVKARRRDWWLSYL